MKTYGLVGRNLTHSFSNEYFAEKFENEGITDTEYRLFEMDTLMGLPELIERENIQGLNVTIPFKEKIINMLDELDPIARKIGAVNTIKVVGDKLMGYNTDVIGFQESLEPMIRTLKLSALILGTGGAAKAVAHVLRELKIPYYFVSREPSFMNELHYDQISEGILSTHKLIVNASPAGMYPYNDTFPPIPYQHLTKEHILYDLVYNPEQTVFMTKGREFGALAVNGIKMLHIQADKSWELWNPS